MNEDLASPLETVTIHVGEGHKEGGRDSDTLQDF